MDKVKFSECLGLEISDEYIGYLIFSVITYTEKLCVDLIVNHEHKRSYRTIDQKEHDYKYGKALYHLKYPIFGRDFGLSIGMIGVIKRETKSAFRKFVS